MKKFIMTNKIGLVLALLLLAIPFFWHHPGEIDYGGDSTRLYFYDPDSWLKNIAKYFVSSLLPLGEAMPNFSMVNFLYLLKGIKWIFGNSSFLTNNFFNGILLAGGFLSMFLIIKELIDEKFEETTKNWSALIGGLFFVFSPMLIFQWERALYGLNQIFLYPFIFLLFLKYLKTSHIGYLMSASFVIFVFAMNFSFPTLPWFFAFFPFAFLFLFLLSVVKKRIRVFVKGLFFLILFSLAVNAFDIIPQLYTIKYPSQMMSLDEAKLEDKGLTYFLSIQPLVRLTYNITGQDQYLITQGYNSPLGNDIYSFGIKLLPLFFVYPLTIVIGCLFEENISKKQKKIIALLRVFFLILLLMVTANITNFDLALYKLFFRFPFFSMFRSYYSKFAMVYLFFYGLLLALSLTIVMEKVKKKTIKYVVIFIFILLSVYNGWPLISGRIVKAELWQSDKVGISSEIDSKYQLFLNVMKTKAIDGKVLSLPLTAENYQILWGKNRGAYFGPSTISLLGGKNSFSGVGGFSIFWPQVEKFIETNDTEGLNKLLGILNINYIFHNADDKIYDKFPYHPYSEWLKKYFPNQIKIADFIKTLGVKPLLSISSFNLSERKNFTTPFLFSPKNIICGQGELDIISDLIGYKDYGSQTAILLNQNKDICSDIFIKAVNGEEKSIGILNDVNNTKIFYPYIKRKPLWLWKLTLFYENYKQRQSKKNPEVFFDQILFFANKRVNEATLLKTNLNNLRTSYIKQLDEAFEFISLTVEIEKKLKYSAQLKRNMDDNLKILKERNVPDYDLWKQSINDRLIVVEDLILTAFSQSSRYFTDITETRKFSLFLHRLKNGQPTFDDLWLYGNDEEILKKEKSSNLKDQWFLWTELDLKKGKASFEIKKIKQEQDATVNLLLRPEENKKEEFVFDKKAVITYEKKDPTKYKVFISHFERKPIFIVMNDGFNNGWKMYNSDGKQVPEDKHFLVNGYANMWQIEPEMLNSETINEFTIEFYPQKYYFFGRIISRATIFIMMGYLIIRSFYAKKK